MAYGHTTPEDVARLTDKPKFRGMTVGHVGSYIHDLTNYGLFLRRIKEVDYRVAIDVLKRFTPEANLGGAKAKELEVGKRGHQWHNKFFVITCVTNDHAEALFNQDGEIYLYRITHEGE